MLHHPEKYKLKVMAVLRKTLSSKLIDAKKILQADEKQMAKHLKITLTSYKEIESGARVLPLPAQISIERRIEGLMKRCGLK